MYTTQRYYEMNLAQLNRLKEEGYSHTILFATTVTEQGDYGTITTIIYTVFVKGKN